METAADWQYVGHSRGTPLKHRRVACWGLQWEAMVGEDEEEGERRGGKEGGGGRRISTVRSYNLIA